MGAGPLRGQESTLKVYEIKRSGQVSAPPPSRIIPSESASPTPTASSTTGELSSSGEHLGIQVFSPRKIDPETQPKVYQWEHAAPKSVSRPNRVVEPANYVDHSILARVFKKYVTKSGWVDYEGLKRDKRVRKMLEDYVHDLSEIDPSSLKDPFDRLASWLNLYNAMIIEEILKHYPVKSVMEIKDFFGERRYKIGHQTYSFIDIEKEIFQKEIHEPRAVFARVNGTSSGPRLLKEPFNPLKLDKQLEDRTWNFLMNRENVDYDPRRHMLILSPVFTWYPEELMDVGTFLHSYLDKLPNFYSVTYRGYDWRLNDERLH